jgi:hypothetical protein
MGRTRQEMDHEKGGNGAFLPRFGLNLTVFWHVSSSVPLDRWAVSWSALAQVVGSLGNHRVLILGSGQLSPTPRYGTVPRV